MAGPWERYAAPSPAATPRAQPQRQQRQQIRFADDVDAVARTLIGEAGNQGEQGMLAVGGVIANRARQRGLTPSQVVLEKSQFEPWGNPETTARLLSIDPQSPEYQSARVLAQRALSGDHPVGNASHFYAPRAQAALGRPAPSWDNGAGRAIGDHLFFDLEGGAQAEQPAGEGPWARYAAAPAAEAAQPAEAPQGTPLNTDIKDGVWVQGTGGDNDWTYMSRERADRLNDPEYQRAFADAQRGSANVPDALRAVGQGQTLGFLDEINALAQGGLQGLENIGRQVRGEEIEYGMGAAAQAARDAERDAQAQYARENPVANFGLQLAGGLATPGLAAGGNFINAAQGTGRLARAAQVGGGYGVAAGLGNAEGDLLERAPSAALSGVVGAGTGVIGQGVVERIGRGAAARAAQPPSNARLLSREGVDLTPGQMMSEVPVIGNMVRSIEEGASSIPFVGAPIAGARQQSVETFNRAALNRVLEPLNQRLPRNVRAGYGAVEDAQQRVSRAYDQALSGVQLIPDEAMYDGLGRAINDAVENSGVTGARRVTREINERVFRVLGDYADNPINGQQFKALESEFGNLASTALESSDGATRAVGRAYQAVNDTLRRTLREQNPQAADDLRAANSAYARLMRVEKAAGSSVAQGSDGVFSPTQLGMAVAQSGSRRANARGDALMQDLAVAGRNIIPSRTGDSGTATRGAITGGVAAMASGVPIAGTVAIPVIASSIAYSRPAQALLNAAYRATDSRAASEALQDLARLAQRDPALVPYYEGAVQHVLGLAQRDTPTAPPAPPGVQAPTPALQRVLQ